MYDAVYGDDGRTDHLQRFEIEGGRMKRAPARVHEMTAGRVKRVLSSLEHSFVLTRRQRVKNDRSVIPRPVYDAVGQPGAGWKELSDVSVVDLTFGQLSNELGGAAGGGNPE